MLKRSLVWAGAVALLDQWLKVCIQYQLKKGLLSGPHEIFPPVFYVTYVKNTGSAWGLFPERYWILGCFGCIALILLFCLHKQFNLQYRWNSFFWGILIGGIIGNTIDRFRLGYVIDFLDFRFGHFEWPAFNIADTAISISVIYYLLSSILKGHKIK